MDPRSESLRFLFQYIRVATGHDFENRDAFSTTSVLVAKLSNTVWPPGPQKRKRRVSRSVYIRVATGHDFENRNVFVFMTSVLRRQRSNTVWPPGPQKRKLPVSLAVYV